MIRNFRQQNMILLIMLFYCQLCSRLLVMSDAYLLVIFILDDALVQKILIKLHFDSNYCMASKNCTQTNQCGIGAFMTRKQRLRHLILERVSTGAYNNTERLPECLVATAKMGHVGRGEKCPKRKAYNWMSIISALKQH